MQSHSRFRIAAFLSLPFLMACGAPKKFFRIASHPPGATVYLNDEKIGVTDMDRLKVDFADETTRAVIRVEKDGYFSTGAVLGAHSDPYLYFFLNEAPNNSKILEVLANLQRTLAQLAAQLERNATEKP